MPKSDEPINPAELVYVSARVKDLPTPYTEGALIKHCTSCLEEVWVDKPAESVADNSGEVICIPCFMKRMEKEEHE